MAGSQRLARLREAGASVDEETGVVRFPAELVDRLRRQCPREIVMAGAAPGDDVVLSEGGCPLRALRLCRADPRPPHR